MKQRKPRTPEHCRRISEAKKKLVGWKHSQETRRKISISHMGKKRPEMIGDKNPKWKGGVTHPNCLDCSKPVWRTAKRCYRCRGIFNSRERSPNWQGGVTPIYQALRGCFEYRQWRSDVFTRDGYSCQRCGDNKGGNLEADHLKPFALIIRQYDVKTLDDGVRCSELWDINNGMTLCHSCHKDKHKKK